MHFSLAIDSDVRLALIGLYCAEIQQYNPLLFLKTLSENILSRKIIRLYTKIWCTSRNP